MKYSNGFNIRAMPDFKIIVGLSSGPNDDFGFSLDTDLNSSLSLIGWNEKEVVYLIRNFSKTVVGGSFLLRLGPTLF